jgi:flagellar biosynthetic protein FliS
MDDPIRPPLTAAQQTAARDYLLRQLEQATPAQQLVMLLDGACKFVMMAKDAIGRGDIGARYNANARAIEIISYLLGQVDPERGGEAAQRLFRIYGKILQRLSRIDFENSAVVCDEIVAYIRPLRNAFAGQPVAAAPSGTVVAGPSPAGLPPIKRSATA